LFVGVDVLLRAPATGASSASLAVGADGCRRRVPQRV